MGSFVTVLKQIYKANYFICNTKFHRTPEYWELPRKMATVAPTEDTVIRHGTTASIVAGTEY